RWSPTGEPIKTKEFFEFDSLRTIARDHDPLFARSYQMAAKLSFDLKKDIPKLRDMNRKDFYDFISESLPEGDRFYVLAEKTDTLPLIHEKAGYKIVEKTPIADQFELWEVRR